MKTSYIFIMLSVLLLSCQGKEDNQAFYEEDRLQTESVAEEISGRAVRFTMINKHIIIPTLINDSVTANLLLDTGAGGYISLDSSFARQKGFIPTAYYGDQTTFKGRGQYIRGLNYLREKVIPIKVNDVLDTLGETVVFDLRSITQHDKADGMLELKFMQQHIMEINFKDSLIFFHKPEDYQKPANVTTIPMIFDERMRLYFLDVEFNIDDSLTIRDKALIDLGNGGSKIFFGPYKVRKNNLLDHVSEKSPISTSATTMTREKIEGFYGRIKSAKVHDLVIDTPRVMLSTSKRGVSSLNLILIGNYVFSRYDRVIFDFGQRSIYIDDI